VIDLFTQFKEQTSEASIVCYPDLDNSKRKRVRQVLSATQTWTIQRANEWGKYCLLPRLGQFKEKKSEASIVCYPDLDNSKKKKSEASIVCYPDLDNSKRKRVRQVLSATQTWTIQREKEWSKYCLLPRLGQFKEKKSEASTVCYPDLDNTKRKRVRQVMGSRQYLPHSFSLWIVQVWVADNTCLTLFLFELAKSGEQRRVGLLFFSF
jgi:hypothetical protein